MKPTSRPVHRSLCTRLAAAALAAVLMSACSTVAPIAMTPPQGFGAQSEALVANNRSSASGLFADESFDLGPYRVTGVKRDLMASGDSFSVGLVKAGQTSAGFAYVLQAANERLQARCEVKNSELKLPILGNSVPLKSKFGLSCQCQGQGTDARLEVASDSGWQQEDAWVPKDLKITIAQQSFTGSPFDHLGHSIGDGRAFVGYRFDAQAGPAAAVGLFSPGEVFLHQGLAPSQRAAMTCALAGLLLHAGP